MYKNTVRVSCNACPARNSSRGVRLMSSRDKKAEEIIEETMQGIFNDLNRSKSMNEMDDSDDIPRKKSSGKKTS